MRCCARCQDSGVARVLVPVPGPAMLRGFVRRVSSALLGGPTPPFRRVDVPPFTFWEWRSGAGSPVVMIHGLSGSSIWWRRNVPAFAERHLVSAIDLVGFGRNRSFWRPGPLPAGLEEAASVLARWIESTFSGPVHLIGHSMGGQVAIHVADLRPDLVRSLVLVGSTGVPFSLELRQHLRNVPRPPAGLWSFSRVLAWDFLRAGPTSIAVASARMLTDDARDAMRSIRVPTLLVAGDRDPLVPEIYAERMQREIAHSSLVVIPEAGHVSMWDNPEAFNREVLDFLEAVEQDEPTGEKGVEAAIGGESGVRDVLPQNRRARPSFRWALRGCAAELCYRQADTEVRIVMVHGLGMSSSYFRPLAEALHNRGWPTAAIDLAGFGYSADAPARSPLEHAESVVRWCEAVGIRRAIFLGHSTGCHVVRALREVSPTLVAGSVFLAPIWTVRRGAIFRLAGSLLIDVFREPLRLFPLVVREYWRTGFVRWFGTFLKELPAVQARGQLGLRALVIAGSRDPLTDWQRLNELSHDPIVITGGAHALNVSHPDEVAQVLVSSATLSVE